MLVSDFDFDLPSDLIAQRPPEARDGSRMLVAGDRLLDKSVRDFVDFLRPGDVVALNDSKVIPARFDAGGHEITLHTSDGGEWWGLAKKFGKLKIGERLKLDDGSEIEITDKDSVSGVKIKFPGGDALAALEKVGKIPLPPYIKRRDGDDDRERYQTVYANPPGSMAAPTAGLHFTPGLLAEVEKAGAKIVTVTLHVGAGTWMPVKVADTKDHKMHGEWGVITPEQAEVINGAKRVIAVGTTALRLLESAAVINPNAADGGKFPSFGGDLGRTRIAPFRGTTDIFITPGYRFRAVDALLTNFHLPKSTLFMLVCAFAGTDEMKAAYAHAVLEKYRFFSYGDCCLLFKKETECP
ncbi:MAG: tRNA preQ1(34) S-adenosylmethionine ribosyltransferase-isomerase QueA [Rickettsiales bacterium]|jgi:S-adenosylmethionine:tRNA ribosyltransferase-isomerase|nr:tRNA preQ1(34) S-adenosylmethionine ribosyltransferase-isomerase QueA [Rickettsiales bacterium]